MSIIWVVSVIFFFAFLGVSFVAYSLASDLQGQNAVLARIERTLEEGFECESAASELLQAQLDLLEQEVSGNPIEDLDARLMRARRNAEFFERAHGMGHAHHAALIRVAVLSAIKASQS